MNAQPSAAAQEGIANAQYQAKNTGDAYEAYDRLLKDYAGGKNKPQATARLKELAPLTGYISIRVNESGATVSIDGKAIGASPVAALIRVSSGPHKVDVVKDGFAPLSKSPNVGANGKEIVEITLAREATTGHLAIREKTGAPVRVLVDGDGRGRRADRSRGLARRARGRAPELDAGLTPRRRCTIARGETLQVEHRSRSTASAHPRSGHDERPQGDHLPLDTKPVAEGAYVTGTSRSGRTLIAVTRDGYERYDKKITLVDKQSLTETVTLKRPDAQASAGPPRPVERAPSLRHLRRASARHGPVSSPGGESERDRLRTAAALAASSCKMSSNPIGGGLDGLGRRLCLASGRDRGCSSPASGRPGDAAARRSSPPRRPLENPLRDVRPSRARSSSSRSSASAGSAALRGRASRRSADTVPA